MKTAEYLFKLDQQRFLDDYQEAIEYLLKITNNEVGVGVQPMSFLAASHAEINRKRKMMEAALRAIKDRYASDVKLLALVNEVLESP